MAKQQMDMAPVPPVSPEVRAPLPDMGSLLLGQAVDVQQPTDLLLEDRNQRLEAALNPDGTLPSVTFTNTYERDPRQSKIAGFDSVRNTVLNAAGEDVGYAIVTTPYGKKDSPAAVVEEIRLVKEQGYGKATYLEVLKKLPVGVVLRSAGQGSVSPDALRLWRWMETAGVARNFGEQDPVPDDKGNFRGVNFRTVL